MAKHRKRVSKKVPAKGRLRDMADSLWSVAIRSDWLNRCAVCGIIKCEAHHLVPRQYEATRYDLRNGIALCASHHQFDPDISPHQNAAGWILWIHDNHPSFHAWYLGMTESGDYRDFGGTKNPQHYIDVIVRLREHVEPEDFKRIVGVKFSMYLDVERQEV